MVVWPRLCDPFASQNTIIIIVIILILGRFSLEFEGQQTFSGLQDFSQYFHWSKQCSSFDCSYDIQFLHFYFKTFWECSKRTNQVFVLISLYSLTDMLLPVGIDVSNLKEYFSSIVHND